MLAASGATCLAALAYRHRRRRRRLSRTAAQVTLTYFDMAGKAEAIRFAFALGNRKFHDRRLTVDEFRHSVDEFPFGSIPVLDVSGERIAQSEAILRLAGALAGLAPADPVVAARIDQYLALENDFSYPFTCALFPEKCYLPAWTPGARTRPHTRDAEVPWRCHLLKPPPCNLAPPSHTDAHVGDPTPRRRLFAHVRASSPRPACFANRPLAEALASYRLSISAHHVPTFLKFVDEALERSPSGWLAGTDGPSIADLCWAPRLSWLESGALDWLPRSTLQQFPHARALVDRVYSLPAVIAFRELEQQRAAAARAD